MVMVSRSLAFVAVASVALTAVIEASPIQYDPYTPVNISVPLTPSHPAYGGPTKKCVEPIVPQDPNVLKAQALKP
ncbi:hypothetical protein PF005_g27004 [Phytophthora fragariae]|nr:hypothetical protein PF003_g31382 [Phytophthora fragariae]KAE8932556.1 hypothetical protein PF009_g17420 [Phytophthora fragariae]KAE8973788.1 hypothetical protein PF011_g25115 [Phytophthora fragariae]KAE9070270.1 hypothetical protein PF007_g27003 [Phytophthora fragariae]KAE9072618.1 hypothetical protein PF010_g25415 [Phytophthora fragariae]